MSYLTIKVKNILTNVDNCEQFLYFGDAVKFIRQFPDNSIKFLTIDPPFNMWQELIDNNFIEELKRVLHNDGNMLLWCSSTVRCGEELSVKNKVVELNMMHDEIIWVNNTKGNKLRGEFHTMNYIGAKIIWAVKDNKTHNNSTATFDRYCGPYIYKGKKVESWSMVNGKIYFLNKNIGGRFNRACIKNFYSINVDPRKNPPYKKPDELLKIFYRAFVTDPSVVVVDLFGGSGGFINLSHENKNTCFTAEIDQERCFKMLDEHEYLKVI